MPRTTKAAHITTPHVKAFWVRFHGKYRVNELHLKLISSDFWFPATGAIISAGCAVLRVNKRQNYAKKGPGRKIMLPFFWEFSFLRSRVKLGLNFDLAADTLHTHVEGPNRTV